MNLRYLEYAGIPILVEVESGGVRGGPGWSTKHTHPYGRIPGHIGADGEQVDVYLSDTHPTDTGQIFRVIQNKPDGSYDEDKFMFGFPHEQSATDAYQAHMPADRYGGTESMTTDQFKQQYLKDGPDSTMESKAMNTSYANGDEPVKTQPDYGDVDKLTSDLQQKVEEHKADEEALRTELSDQVEHTADMIDQFVGKEATKEHPAKPFDNAKDFWPEIERQYSDDLRLTEVKMNQEVITPNGPGVVEDIWNDGKQTLVRLDASGELKSYTVSRLRKKEAVQACLTKLAEEFPPGSTVQLKPEFGKKGVVLYATPYMDLMVSWSDGHNQRVNPELLQKTGSRVSLAEVRRLIQAKEDDLSSLEDETSEESVSDEDSAQPADAADQLEMLNNNPPSQGGPPQINVIITNPEDLDSVMDILNELDEHEESQPGESEQVGAEMAGQIIPAPPEEGGLEETEEEPKEDKDLDETLASLANEGAVKVAHPATKKYAVSDEAFDFLSDSTPASDESSPDAAGLSSLADELRQKVNPESADLQTRIQDFQEEDADLQSVLDDLSEGVEGLQSKLQEGRDADAQPAPQDDPNDNLAIELIVPTQENITHGPNLTQVPAMKKRASAHVFGRPIKEAADSSTEIVPSSARSDAKANQSEAEQDYKDDQEEIDQQYAGGTVNELWDPLAENPAVEKQAADITIKNGDIVGYKGVDWRVTLVSGNSVVIYPVNPTGAQRIKGVITVPISKLDQRSTKQAASAYSAIVDNDGEQYQVDNIYTPSFEELVPGETFDEEFLDMNTPVPAGLYWDTAGDVYFYIPPGDKRIASALSAYIEGQGSAVREVKLVKWIKGPSTKQATLKDVIQDIKNSRSAVKDSVELIASDIQKKYPALKVLFEDLANRPLDDAIVDAIDSLSEHGEESASNYFNRRFNKLGVAVKTAYVAPVGSEWGTYSHDGKLLGKHPTKEDAEDQLKAIEVNKHGAKQIVAMQTALLNQDFNGFKFHELIPRLAKGRGGYPAGLNPPSWVPWSLRDIWRHSVERAIEEGGGNPDDPDSARAALGTDPYPAVVQIYKAVMEKHAPDSPVSLSSQADPSRPASKTPPPSPSKVDMSAFDPLTAVLR